jgi:hypothetical protein
LDGGVILIADRFDGTTATAYIARILGNGNTRWDRAYTGIDGVSLNAGAVAALPVGGFAAAGTVLNEDETSNDVNVFRLDGMGNIVHQFNYGTAELDEEALGMCGTADGGAVVVGTQIPDGATEPDIYALRIDGDGGIVWERTYGTAGRDAAHDVIALSDGGFAIAGEAPRIGGTGDADMLLLVIDADGAMQFDRHFGGEDDDVAFTVEMASDGGFLLAGVTRSFGNEERGAGYLVRTDADGNLDLVGE